MKNLLFILLIIPILLSCNKSDQDYMPVSNFTDNSKPVSYGNHQDVYLFTNETLQENTAKIMKDQFGYPFEGAQKERTFFLIWKNFEDFEELEKAKNIIFICNLSIPSNFTAFIESKVPQAKLDQVMAGSPTILTYQNEWSDDQLVTFILASDSQGLDRIILSRIANLYLDYEQRFLARMTRRVYYRGSLDYQFSNYNFSITLPSTFQVYKEDKEDNLISFIYRYKKKNTILPDKFITVYSEKIDIDEFDQDWVKASRSKIGKDILDGDRIDWMRTRILPKTFTTWDKVSYNGFILEGAWENDNTNMGGTFKSYTFYDESTSSAYFIDTAVYYPAGTKVPFITELEGIAKSFKIKESK